MIRFAKQRYFCFTGSPFRNVFKLKISDKNGSEELVKVGKEDFQDYIESFRDSCDLAVIISRVNAGETDLLTKSVGVYGDFRGMPETKAEMMQQLIDAKHVWDSLTQEQRSKFDGFSDFAGSAGEKEWLKKLGVEIPEVDPNDLVIEKEVKSDAQP